MSAAGIVAEILLGVLRAGGEGADFLETLTGRKKADLEERLERARDAVRDPIDTSAEDAARRARLRKIFEDRDDTPTV